MNPRRHLLHLYLSFMLFVFGCDLLSNVSVDFYSTILFIWCISHCERHMTLSLSISSDAVETRYLGSGCSFMDLWICITIFDLDMQQLHELEKFA